MSRRRKSLAGSFEAHAASAKRGFESAYHEGEKALGLAKAGHCKIALSWFKDAVKTLGSSESDAEWAGTPDRNSPADAVIRAAESQIIRSCFPATTSKLAGAPRRRRRSRR